MLYIGPICIEALISLNFNMDICQFYSSHICCTHCLALKLRISSSMRLVDWLAAGTLACFLLFFLMSDVNVSCKGLAIVQACKNCCYDK